MRADLYCFSCRRHHGRNDERHRRAAELWDWQLYLWSDQYKPAPVYPSGPACGDCEAMPCRCDIPSDLDLAWLPTLADHNPIDALQPRELVA